MSKNIVIFSDGTGQDGGVRPEQRWSNIYKMYRVCRNAPETNISPQKQVAFYDPGLGTETSATGWTNLSRRVRKLLANVDGRGIATNIADCYEFIINHYQPGDRIFLFGFSRGAYTVRSVANLLMLCGVPTKDSDKALLRFRGRTRLIAEEAVTTVLEHGAGHPRAKFEGERLEMARRFREKYGSHHETLEEHRSNAAPYFIGVFDTVAALGAAGIRRIGIQAALYGGSAVLGVLACSLIVALAALLGLDVGRAAGWAAIVSGAAIGSFLMWHAQRKKIKKTIRDYPNIGDKKTHKAEWKGDNFDRLLSRFVPYARAANAIDENRADFARVAWGATRDTPEKNEGVESFKQIWFAGNHSDIGGSYPETESRLSDIALQWMIEEALSVPAPLCLGPVFINDKKLTASSQSGTPLYIYPAADGLQHCEVSGTQDFLRAKVPSFLHRLPFMKGWAVKMREIKDDAPLHSTVIQRLALETVPQCNGSGPYRPEALRNHDAVKGKYEYP